MGQVIFKPLVNSFSPTSVILTFYRQLFSTCVYSYRQALALKLVVTKTHYILWRVLEYLTTLKTKIYRQFDTQRHLVLYDELMTT